MTPEQCAHKLIPPDAAEQPDRPPLTLVPEDAPKGAFLSSVVELGIDINLLREYTINDLRLFFTSEEMETLEADSYFREPGEEIDLEEFEPTFAERFKILLNNTGTYDDEIEDAISSDDIMEKLRLEYQRLRGRHVSDEQKEIMQKVRARRSVIAYLESIREN